MLVKNKIMKRLSLLTLILLTFFACRNNIDDELTSSTTINPPIVTTIDFEQEVVEVVATLYGEVFDESGSPISNASVTLDGNNTTTDESGRFLFNDMTMNQLGTFVLVNKDGFFTGSKRFFPDNGSINYVRITLLDRTNIGNFVADNGGTISSSEGISIDFPANSIIDGNGDLYQGTVEVAARWIDPSADNLEEIMPGSLQGLMPGGAQGIGNELEEVALASFGMIAVELEDNNGASLNLGNDQKATLTFPIPNELLANAPSEIPLWFFNETVGLWVIEGSASLIGDQYVGEVSHFSFWNCDVPFDLTNVCGTILSSSGFPIANANIQIKILSSGLSRSGYTNSNGEFSGKIPSNELLEMTVFYWDACGSAILTESLGPLPVNSDSTCTDLGTFIVNNSVDAIEITGNFVDCSGSPITNGWLEINLDGIDYVFYIDDGSNFSTTLINCNGQTELTALAGNIDDLMFSNETTFPITNPLDLGTITACDNLLAESLTVTIDGVETVYPNVGFSFPGINQIDTIPLIISGQTIGTDELVRFDIINGIEGPNSYTNNDISFANIGVITTSEGLLFSNCGVFSQSGICDFSQIDILTFGNVGELVTGQISGSVEFIRANGSTITEDIVIEFSILRDQ